MTEIHLSPKVPKLSSVRQKMLHKQKKSKSNYDKHTKPLKPLNIGEGIRIQQGKVWNPAVVKSKVHDRSYLVETQNGSIFRRNRNHLLKSHEKPFTLGNEQSSQPISRDIPSDNNVLSKQTPQVFPRDTHIPADKNTQQNSSFNQPLKESSSNNFTRSGRVVIKPKKLDM
jgi:hypothetical protein